MEEQCHLYCTVHCTAYNSVIAVKTNGRISEIFFAWNMYTLYSTGKHNSGKAVADGNLNKAWEWPCLFNIQHDALTPPDRGLWQTVPTCRNLACSAFSMMLRRSLTGVLSWACMLKI